jgi:hypothetical protein
MTVHLDQDNTHVRESEREAAGLRELLGKAKKTELTDTKLAILIDVVDSLVEQVARQARAIDELRSDLTHKQGIVTKIGGGDFVG